MVDAVPLGKIVGDNVRRMRTEAGLTGDALSKAFREFGPWPTSRVSELELGRVSPTAATLFAVASGLSSLLGRTILVADLFRHDGNTEIGKVSLPASAVVDAFAGKPAELPPAETRGVELDLTDFSGPDLPHHEIAAVLSTSGEPEERLARGLGITEVTLAAFSAKMWGQSFSAQRDQIVGSDANAQKRGQASRRLKAALAAELDQD